MDYKEKYAKYKAKYLYLKNNISKNSTKKQTGGNMVNIVKNLQMLLRMIVNDQQRNTRYEQIGHIFSQLQRIESNINQFFSNVIPNIDNNGLIIVDSQNMSQYQNYAEFNYTGDDAIIQNNIMRASPPEADLDIITNYITHQSNLKHTRTYANNMSQNDKLSSTINLCTVLKYLTDSRPTFLIIHRTSSETSLHEMRPGIYALSVAYGGDRNLDEVDDLLCVAMLNTILQENQQNMLGNVSILSRDAYNWTSEFGPELENFVNTHRTLFDLDKNPLGSKVVHHAPEGWRQQIMRFNRI